MRVAIFNADEGGCGSYRLLFPAAVLQADGADITIQPKFQAVREQNPVLGDFLYDVPIDADVVVFQRPLRRELVETIPVLQRRGVAVVIEVDDDFHALPKSHPAVKLFAPRHHPERNWRWLQQACELADLVTCTTPALASRYGAHGRVAVLPNCVPGWYLDVEREPHDPVSVTWTGIEATHIGDLEIVGDAIGRVQRDTGCGFRAVGSARTLELLGVEGEVLAWRALVDRGPDGYAAAIAGADVGLVPLADSKFNQAKSALKMSEFAALGVVPVMSATPDNIRMFQHGIGFLADTPADWARHVRALVTNDAMRVDEAERGREVMRAWTYEQRSHLWWEAWEQALANRREGVAA